MYPRTDRWSPAVVLSKIRCQRCVSTRRRTLRAQSQPSRVRDRHSKCKRNPTKQLTKVTSSSRKGTHQVAMGRQCSVSRPRGAATFHFSGTRPCCIVQEAAGCSFEPVTESRDLVH